MATFKNTFVNSAPTARPSSIAVPKRRVFLTQIRASAAIMSMMPPLPKNEINSKNGVKKPPPISYRLCTASVMLSSKEANAEFNHAAEAVSSIMSRPS